MNLFINIPAPSGNGSGAPVDVSTFGALKTILLSGDVTAQVNVEVNNSTNGGVPNGSWSVVASFSNPGVQTVLAAAKWMRCTVSGYKNGTPQVDVGGTNGGSLFTALPVTPSSGDGAAVDTSALGLFKTVTVGEVFRGGIVIEVSEDGATHWGTAFSFSQPGTQSAMIAANWMRARRVGVPSIAPGLPIIGLGASSDTGGGGGGGGITVDDEGAPIAGNPHTTLNFVGAGVVASDAGGGVATVTIPGATSGITVDDEGAPIAGNPHTTLNFVGAGVVASDAGGGVAAITIPGGVTVDDEGAPIAGNPHATLNFVGAGVVASDAGGGVAAITIPGGVTVDDEGAPIAGNPHSTLNFVGAGVVASDAGGGVATVTIPGATSGITVDDEGAPIAGNPHTTLNFVGAGVVASDAGGGVATITIPATSGITINDEGAPIAGNPHTTLNFVGAGVVASDAGGGVAAITIPAGGDIPANQILHLRGAFFEDGSIFSVALPAGNTNNMAVLNANTNILLVTPNNPAGSVITGIDPTSLSPAGFGGLVNGRMLTLYNAGGNGNLTIANLNAGSAAANQIVTPGLVNIVLGVGDSVSMFYDSAAPIWRIIK